MGESLVSAADVEQFNRDGVLKLSGVFDKHWLNELTEGVEQNLADPGRYAKYYTPEGADGYFFGVYCNWQRIAGYRNTASQSPAAAIAADSYNPVCPVCVCVCVSIGVVEAVEDLGKVF